MLFAALTRHRKPFSIPKGLIHDISKQWKYVSRPAGPWEETSFLVLTNKLFNVETSSSHNCIVSYLQQFHLVSMVTHKLDEPVPGDMVQKSSRACCVDCKQK
ncbi:hypothetical protein V6N13_129258 [Hibiscus sabdariffa]